MNLPSVESYTIWNIYVEVNECDLNKVDLK